MRILNQQTALEPIDAVTPHPKNPRRGDTEAIQASVQELGFYGVVIAQRSTGHILAGNHRYLAAQAAGASEIPVTWLDVTDEQALKILLADNRTSDRATYDDEALAALLREMLETTSDLTALGFTGDDINRALKALHPDDDDTDDAEAKLAAAATIQAKWLVEPGDTWLIPSQTSPGTHRLVCGDSTDPTVVAQACPTPADMIFTDPPYGVAYEGGTDDAMTIKNDTLTGDHLRAFIQAAANAWPLRPGGAYYVCAPSGPQEIEFRLALRDANMPHRQNLVWVKQSIVLGHSDYHYQHESILYGWRPGANRFFTGDRTQASVIGAPPALTKLTPPELRDMIRELRRQLRTTAWLEDKPAASRLHPTTKPIHLATRAIYNSTLPGQLIFDGFSGSGSTGLAAEATARTYAGIELDPTYLAVSLERFAERGLTPTRHNPSRPTKRTPTARTGKEPNTPTP